MYGDISRFEVKLFDQKEPWCSQVSPQTSKIVPRRRYSKSRMRIAFGNQKAKRKMTVASDILFRKYILSRAHL